MCNASHNTGSDVFGDEASQAADHITKTNVADLNTAHFAYIQAFLYCSCEVKSSITQEVLNTQHQGTKIVFTSWLDTSEWSSRVMPSPIALFMSRDSDGSTLIGG